MNSWIKAREKCNFIEYVGVIAMVICIAVGMLCDMQVEKGNIYHFVEDINTFSLTLLQIQASVGTLTIAIVALISGNISDSYMGISVSDFYLNIRPKVLKQRNIIYTSIFFLVTGIVCHLWNKYNLVIGVFIATVILIAISISEIYSVFSGRRIWEKEIEGYFTYVLYSEKDYQKKVSLCEEFISDWQEQIEIQDRVVFEKYVENSEKYLQKLLQYKSNQSIQDVQQLSYTIINGLLKSDKRDIKIRGIKYIEIVYEMMWNTVLNNLTEMEGITVEFSLFRDIQFELQDAISEMPSEIVEKSLNWRHLSDDIERVACWLNDDSKKSYILEIESINHFSRFLGFYLANQKLKSNIINFSYWGEILKNLYLSSAYNVPTEKADDFLYGKVGMYFAYCYGMLISGFGNVVKDNLYLYEMKNMYFIKDRYKVLLFLSVQCYLFYLAEREDEECVASEIKQEAERIINDANIKLIFTSFLHNLSCNENFLDVTMEKDILSLLKRYELFPRYSSVKTIIMQDVIREFYIFIVIYIAHSHYLPSLIDKAINEQEVSEYYLHFLGNKEIRTKNTFKKMYSLIVDKYKSEEQINLQVGLLYEKLERVIKQKYKEQSIIREEENQKEYCNIDERKMISGIKNKVENHLKEVFSSIIINDDNRNGIIKVHLLRCDYLTKSLNEESINGCYSDIDGVFVDGIRYILQSRKAIDKINKECDFADDIEYINYLKQRKVNMLLGSEYVLRNRDYKKSQEYKSFAENCECIYTSFIRYGLALKRDDIKVCIHDINVSIHPLTFGELNSIEYNSETKKYIYEISSGMSVEFEKSELESFIYNQRKILDISAKISVVVTKENVGTIVEDYKVG